MTEQLARTGAGARGRRLVRGLRATIADGAWPDRAARGLHLAYFALFEGPQGRGRPVATPTWDGQWREGQWDHLASVDELPRYAVIAGYIRAAPRRASVLDVGCGHGELLGSLGAGLVSRYHGIDLSAEAVAQARRRGMEGATFEVADLTGWTAADTYDVVVLNEVLYYVRDPVAEVARYRDMLTPGGLLVISMFRHGNTRLIWRDLRRQLPVRPGAEVKNRLGEIVDVQLLDSATPR